MTRGFLITISGVDGSGKSSHSLALQESLAERGYPVVRAWAGHKPTLSYPFLALVRLLGYTHRRKVGGVVLVWRDISRNIALSKLWPLFLVLDFIPKALLNVTFELWRGRTVVCDRYVIDLIAELAHYDLIGPTARRILLGLVPYPRIAFLMDVSEGTAQERMMVPGRAREQPAYDLSRRRRVYLQLAKEFRMVILDGEAEPSRNRLEILNQALASLKHPTMYAS